jgi:hypothetical protein
VVKGFWFWLSMAIAIPFNISPQGTQFFLLLGEVRPFCILVQNDPANKARNWPCSISRAERKRHWPKFFATFQQYTCPYFAALVRLDHRRAKLRKECL